MSKILWNTIKLGPVVLGTALLVANSTLAVENPKEATQANQIQTSIDRSKEVPQLSVAEISDSLVADRTINVSPETSESNDTLEQINQYTNPEAEAEGMDQVTNVSQLRDVRPGDWAYEALRSLVERYGCIAGYPDGTFRGNRALTRYEFAAGMNACLGQIEKLIAARPGGDFASKEDLERIARLTQEFQGELATLGTRVDRLEGRTAFLETHQFSTTTKLNGEVIFAISNAFGERRAVASPNNPANFDDLDEQITFSDRARLNLDTSFTGQDRLRTRIQARNILSFNTGTPMTRLGFEGNQDNNASISRLQYRFPLSSQATVYLDATGGEYNDNVLTFNPLLESSGSGAISRFGRFNPIYRQGDGGAGITFDYRFNPVFNLALGYLTPGGVANNPGPNLGLFNGSYAALAQIGIRPSEAFNLGLTYVRSYSTNGTNVSGGTGSRRADQPFGNVATSANHYGAEASFRLSPAFTISGWAGFTNAIRETNAFRGQQADMFNYAVTLAFPDLGRRGNLGAIIFGQPPKVTRNDLVAGNNDLDANTSYHLEGLYRYRINNNIDITPGLLVIFNPEHNSNNRTVYVGTLRTTFRF